MAARAIHRPSLVDSLITRLKILASTPNGKFVIVLAATALATLALTNHFGRATDTFEQTPFCSPADGVCGEDADKPSPRTVYSARSKAQYDKWFRFQAKLNRTAAAYSKSLNEASPSSRRPLIFLGDSITESFLGTEYGHTQKKWDGIPEVFEEMYGRKYDSLVLAISGDQSQHLLWRMMHGNLLKGYIEDSKAIFYVMIGTNNLGSGHLPDESIGGIMAVIEYILQHTVGRIVVVAVLPRGDSFRLANICPPRCDKEGKPFASFMPAVNKVNAALREKIPALGERVSLVDCGEVFASEERGEEEVDKNLLPDFLHPNAKGHRLLAQCVLECIENGNCQ